MSPKFDFVIKNILDGDADGVVVLKELPMTDQVGKFVIQRMRKILSADDMKRVFFLPPLSLDDYANMYAGRRLAS